MNVQAKSHRRRNDQQPSPLRMAYSIDMRGDDEDIPVLVFIGDPDGHALHEAFAWLVKGGRVAKGFTMEPEHPPVWRNGHAYLRWAITLSQPDYSFCSIETIRLLVESRLQAAGHSATFFSDYVKFINL